jgi:class 3 adenylate cyclase
MSSPSGSNARPAPPSLAKSTASRFAKIALGHIAREYPNKLDHVMGGDADARTPRNLHPIFFGSFDWHSCVHGYWLLATLLRARPEMDEAETIIALFDDAFTDEKVAAEVAYLNRPESRGFERPYGWAWDLMLQAELMRHTDRPWAARHAPLAQAFVERFEDFLPKADYPVRAGVHTNTAFALVLASEYADMTGNTVFRQLLTTKAMIWYGQDAACQAWEPSGDDFLSPALIEAEAMRRLLPKDTFEVWFVRFLPDLANKQPATLFTPARVSDRSDGKIAHLDGLNLSRAWCWRTLAGALPDLDPAKTRAVNAALAHLAAAVPHVAGDYMGEHWLATFAMLALTNG